MIGQLVMMAAAGATGPAPSGVGFIDANYFNVTTGDSQPIPLPPLTQEGDFVLFVGFSYVGDRPPIFMDSDWTTIQTPQQSGGNAWLTLYSRVMTATDISSGVANVVAPGVPNETTLHLLTFRGIQYDKKGGNGGGVFLSPPTTVYVDELISAPVGTIYAILTSDAPNTVLTAPPEWGQIYASNNPVRNSLTVMGKANTSVATSPTFYANLYAGTTSSTAQLAFIATP